MGEQLVEAKAASRQRSSQLSACQAFLAAFCRGWRNLHCRQAGPDGLMVAGSGPDRDMQAWQRQKNGSLIGCSQQNEMKLLDKLMLYLQLQHGSWMQMCEKQHFQPRKSFR